MNGRRAKQLRREKDVPHPGRLHGGSVGANEQSSWGARKVRRKIISRLRKEKEQ